MATEAEKLYVALGASLRDFEKGMDEAQDELDETDDQVDRLSKSLQKLDSKGVDIDVDASDVAKAKALVESIDDADVDVDASSGGAGRAVASAVDGQVGRVASAATRAASSLGLVAGASAALAAALGLAGTAATAVATAGIGGAAVAATLAFEDAADADVASALTELKAVGRGLAKDFTTQMQPVLRDEVVPFLQQLAQEVKAVIPDLVAFSQKWMPSVIDALEGWVDNIPPTLRAFDALATATNSVWEILEGTGELIAFALVGAIERLVRAAQFVAKGFLTLLSKLESSLESLTGMELGSPDWAGMKKSVDGWNNTLTRLTNDIKAAGQESVNELMGNGGGPDGARKQGLQTSLTKSFASVDELRGELEAIDRAFDAGIGEGDELARKIETVKDAMRDAEVSDQAFARMKAMLGSLQKQQRDQPRAQLEAEPAGPMLGGSAASKTPDRISLPKHLQETKRALMQASLSMRLFRSAGQQAMQAISARVGQTIGQILTFQTKVASVKSVFQSVGSAIVSTLQKVVAQLIQAVAQAAILSAVMAAIPGFGQASFAGNFTKVLEGVVPFADGGIVTSPTLGLVGEAGPEAVIPLDRLGQVGGGSITVSVRGQTQTAGRDLVTTYQTTQQEKRRLKGPKSPR